MKTRRRAAAALLVTAVAMLGAGCNSNDPTTVVFQSVCMFFNAAADPALDTVAARDAESSTCDVNDIELVITGASNVLGVQFQVTYDDALVVFAGVNTSESFLRRDGSDLLVIANETGPGTATVGLTRTAGTGVDSDADHDILATMVFIRLATGGQTDVELVNTALLAPGATGQNPEPILPPFQWLGGQFDIN